MVRFQNQAAVRIDNDCVNRRVIALGGISPRNQGQEKEKKRLFHVPLLHTAVKPADASTDTANSDFTTQTFHLPGRKTRWMGLLEVAKTKAAKKVNGNAPSHLLRGFVFQREQPLKNRKASSGSGSVPKSPPTANLTSLCNHHLKTYL
jgi:hypothetical protein